MSILAARQLLRQYVVATLIGATLVGCGASNFTDLNGTDVDFASYRGRWVFVNYWATWCHPCRAEVEQLNHFAREHATTAAVIGVNYDALPPVQLHQAAKMMNIHYTVLQQDPATTLGVRRPQALPVTYVLDPAGRLAGMLAGAQTEQSLLTVIDWLRKTGVSRG